MGNGCTHTGNRSGECFMTVITATVVRKTTRRDAD